MFVIQYEHDTRHHRNHHFLHYPYRPRHVTCVCGLALILFIYLFTYFLHMSQFNFPSIADVTNVAMPTDLVCHLFCACQRE